MATRLALLVVLLAWLSVCERAFGSSAIPPTTPASFVCPNCDLGERGKYGCSVVGVALDTDVRVCKGCPPGRVACSNNNFTDVRNGQGCLDLNTTNDHCGACGNRCGGLTPTCLGGQCACSPDESELCGEASFCDTSAKRCTTCPAGQANCDPFSDGGVQGDCETAIASDVSNCGGCGIECGQGETCSNGQCVCGSTGGRCNYPQVCDGTQCVACTGPTTDLLCSKQNVFDFNGYCTTGKQCAECPAGFADCRATDKSGAADSGTADDCETPITTPSDCGACGAICGQHGAQACCSGTCKCGKFGNNTSPTVSECSLATQCKSTEYCDEQYQMCLPLQPPYEVCNRNAIGFFEDEPGLQAPNLATCGSCDRTESLKAIRNNVCQAFNDTGCGASGVPCRDGQVCQRGKCECDVQISRFFAWSPTLDQDPDGDNKQDPFGKAATGCNAELIMTPALTRLQRVGQAIFRFAECAKLADIPSVQDFTAEEFADPGFRGLICPGGEGKCPIKFCDELFSNLTQKEKAPFCSAVEDAMNKFKGCAINYKLNNRPGGGDLTCANALMRTVAGNNPREFGLLEGYNMLGCRQSFPNWSLALNGPFESFMGRVDTANLLLGGSSVARMSALVAMGVPTIVMAVLFVLV